MKKIMLICAAALFAVSAYPQQSNGSALQLSLEECLEYAYANNYSRQSSLLNQESAEESYLQSRRNRLPNLTASVSETYTHSKTSSGFGDFGDLGELESSESRSGSISGNYSLNTNMTLYQGGNLNETVRQNELAMEQSAYQTAQYDNELTIQVLQAFLNVLSNEELIKYQEALLEASEQQMLQGQLFLGAGTILESDYLLLESQYASDLNSINESRISRENSLTTLKTLMAIDPFAELEIVYPDDSGMAAMSLLPAQNYVVDRAMATMPDVLISGYAVAIAESNVKLAKTGFAPTLSLSGSIGSGHSSGFDDYGRQLSDRLNESVGLSLSIPIFNRNSTRSQVTQRQISLRQAELDEKQTLLNLQQTVIQEYRNVVSASSSYEASVVKQNAYQKSFDAQRALYEAGSLTPVELLQQQNNYISAMNDYIQSKYTFILRRKILDVYIGERIRM